jgi:acyl-CoA thioester hydrolase
MDAYRHVNNTVYLRYLEEGRLRMLGLGDSGQDGWDSRSLVIASIEIAYLRPLVFRPEPVQVVSTVTRLGRASFDISQHIADDDVLYAEATSTLVAVSAQTGLSRPLEDLEREWLGRFAPEPARAG